MHDVWSMHELDEINRSRWGNWKAAIRHEKEGICPLYQHQAVIVNPAVQVEALNRFPFDSVLNARCLCWTPLLSSVLPMNSCLLQRPKEFGGYRYENSGLGRLLQLYDRALLYSLKPSRSIPRSWAWRAWSSCEKNLAVAENYKPLE